MSYLKLIGTGYKFATIPPAHCWFKCENISYRGNKEAYPAQTKIPYFEVFHYIGFDNGEINVFYEY